MRYSKLSLAAQGAIGGAGGFAVAALVLLWTKEIPGDDLSLTFALVFAGVFALFIGVIITVRQWRIRRDIGTGEQAVAYRQALRTGELPADADLQWWRDRLRGGHQRIRIQVLNLAVLAALSVVHAVSDFVKGETVQGWVSIVFVVLLVVALLVQAPTARSRLNRLSAAVEERAAD